MVGYTPDVVVTTWEGFDNTNKEHHLENLGGTGISTLFKTELQEILPYTKQTSFNTKDAATLAKASKSANNSSFWGNVQNGASQVGKKIKKGASSAANSVKKWWSNTTSSILGN